MPKGLKASLYLDRPHLKTAPRQQEGDMAGTLDKPKRFARDDR